MMLLLSYRADFTFWLSPKSKQKTQGYVRFSRKNYADLSTLQKNKSEKSKVIALQATKAIKCWYKLLEHLRPLRVYRAIFQYLPTALPRIQPELSGNVLSRPF